MTRGELIEHLLARPGRPDGPEVFGADEIRQWPDGAHAALIAAGILQPMPPAQVIECDGCERNCFKPVHVRNRPDGQGAAAFIACDEPEDYGRIPVELSRLEQWQAIGTVKAADLAQALGEKEADIGSAAWRKQKAQTAANVRHSRPGGSREKQERIRAIWAGGKYTSRDRCAEEECGALGMSFKAARRALENIPDPK
jgi:hypothetical protein